MNNNGPYSQFTSEKSLVKRRNSSMFIIPHLLSGIKKYFLCKKYNMKLILTRKDSYFKDILHNRIWDSNLIMHPSVQFSCSVVSNSATPWTVAHQASLSITNSWSLLKLMYIELSWWYHPTISSSVIPFSSCLQSFPVSGSFPMSQFFAPGGQSIGASTSVSVLPINIQDWFA